MFDLTSTFPLLITISLIHTYMKALSLSLWATIIFKLLDGRLEGLMAADSYWTLKFGLPEQANYSLRPCSNLTAQSGVFFFLSF